MKYLIAIDSDGTLRHSDGNISDKTKKIIKKVVECGNTVVICTARPRYYTLKVSNEVGLNEYLISQPLYELTQGYIPLLFWQFVPPVSTIDRIKRDIQKVVDTYEKGVLLENKTVHVNARIGKEELVQELKKRGFRFVTKRIDKVEELWNLSDGINSPCEEVVQNIVEQIGVRRYKELCENALYLDLDDLKQLVEDVQGLIFQSL